VGRNDYQGYRPPDPVEVEAALRLRRAYVMAVRELHGRLSGQPSRYDSHPRWDGGIDKRTGRSYKTPVWPRIVRRAKAEGLDPQALVAALFRHWSSDTVPTPNHLFGADVVRRCRAASAAGMAFVARLRTDEANWRTALWAAGHELVDPDAALDAALMDLTRPVSPLFRYCVARWRNRRTAAASWEAAARQQFSAEPEAYRRDWATLLPADLAGVPAGGGA
jgi:hypothetical protein